MADEEQVVALLAGQAKPFLGLGQPRSAARAAQRAGIAAVAGQQRAMDEQAPVCLLYTSRCV